MLAGVAIFILGMNFMEDSLKSLAGRRFKLFLKNQTSNKIKSIAGSAVVTTLLQSSSIVNLLVLSLVGAGVIQMQNALSLMIGANLGTTFSNWIITLIGFKFNIDTLALPLAGITGISLAIFNPDKKVYQWNKFLFGFSFLFLGLGFIKEGMTHVVENADLSRFADYPLVVFFLVGAVLTAIVQSSSATMVLTLSALYSNAITFEMAIGIVLGAEIGTTLKLFFASVRGRPEKKRVALGNFLYNIILSFLFLTIVNPVSYFITDILGIRDNLIGIVFFQSMVNLSGILLFYPFLNVLGRYLEKRFKGKSDESLFISKVPPSHTELAIDALENEIYYFMNHVVAFSTHAFEGQGPVDKKALDKDFPNKTLMEQYEFIKHLHGEIHRYFIQLYNNDSKNPEDAEHIQQIISGLRNAMYAAKNIKDALPDIEQAKNSSNDTKYQFYQVARKKMEDFCNQVIKFLKEKDKKIPLDEIADFYRDTTKSYSHSLQELYKEGLEKHVDEIEISTLLNFNRELYTAFKSLIFAIKDLRLTHHDAEHFDDMPGFIR